MMGNIVKFSNKWVYVGFFMVGVLALALYFRKPTAKVDSVWKPYSTEALQHAVSEHKPVVIDLFAEWCGACHELERTVFSKSNIKAKLSQITALRVDATNIDDPAIQHMMDQYEIIGLPTVLFLDDQGHEIKEARVEGSASVKEFDHSLDILAQRTHTTFKE